MIRFEDVSFGYRMQQPVLEHFSLEIPSGARICLFGPSGRGKSTVLRLLMGLEKPRRGQITGTGGLSFSAVFQEDRLIGDKTILQNAALFSSEEASWQALASLGLAEKMDSLPRELSGGQRRRASLARALAHPFDILILDEALTGLDEDSAGICLAAIDKAARGKILVMATHDLSHAERLGAKTIDI